MFRADTDALRCMTATLGATLKRGSLSLQLKMGTALRGSVSPQP